MVDSVFGKANFAFGPGQLFWDTATGGVNLDLGGTDSITIMGEISKLDLVESQGGVTPQDKAITGQRWQVTAGLSRATLERLEAVVQGFELERNTATTIIAAHGVDLLAQRDSDIAKQLTFKEVIAGEITTDPFGIIDFFSVAPGSESFEQVFDAATQRFFPITFEVFKSLNTSPAGKPKYWSTRTLIT